MNQKNACSITDSEGDTFLTNQRSSLSVANGLAVLELGLGLFPLDEVGVGEGEGAGRAEKQGIDKPHHDCE